MTYTDMKAPVPVVTGIEIPADLGMKKVDRYKEIKDIRRQATDEFCNSGKKNKAKNGKKAKTIAKVLLGIGAALALVFGGKKLIGKFKKP